MDIYGMDTEAGLSSLKGLDTNNSISQLILFNNLLYNLYSFTQDFVYLGKNFLSKIVCVEQKIIFSCVWYIKW